MSALVHVYGFDELEILCIAMRCGCIDTKLLALTNLSQP